MDAEAWRLGWVRRNKGAFLHRKGNSSGSFPELLQVKTEGVSQHWVSAGHHGGRVSWSHALAR